MTARALKTADEQYREKMPFAAVAAPKADDVGRAETSASGPFLRIPPFPGARSGGFAAAAAAPGEDRGNLVALLRSLRVGGTYWAAQPQLPPKYILARSY